MHMGIEQYFDLDEIPYVKLTFHGIALSSS